MGELEEVFKRETGKAYFASLEINTDEAWSLFKLLDKDCSGSLELDEFVSGCLSLKGQAKAMQCAKLDYDNRQMRAMLEEFMDDIELQMAELCGSLNGTLRAKRRARKVKFPELEVEQKRRTNRVHAD